MYKYALFTIFLMISGTFSAQTAVSGGGDFISRYLWRGLDFGNIFSIQPFVALTSGDFEISFWGSYLFTNTAGRKYGNYKDSGAHTSEVGLSYGGVKLQ